MVVTLLRVAARAHVYRRTTSERRAVDLMKDVTKKTEKKNVTQRKVIWNRHTKHKRPEDTSSRDLLWLINYGERTSSSTLALGYPLFGPSLYCCTLGSM